MNGDSEYDNDFGYMQYNEIDAWDCNVTSEFPHPPTNYFAVHVWANEDGPTTIHRQRMRWLKAHYVTLWPLIAQRIVELHPELTETSQLAGAMRDWVSVHLGEHSEKSVELVYDLDLPNEGIRGFFISVSEEGVTDAFVAE